MGSSLMPAFNSSFPFFNQHRRFSSRFRFTRIIFLLVLCTLFANIGVWQLNQSASKTLFQLKNEMYQSKTISINTLIQHQTDRDLNGYHFRALGKFDFAHAIKVPVKNDSGNGFELYVPFFIFGSEKLMLVDRGFFSSLTSPENTAPNFGQQEIQGMLNKSLPHIIRLKMLSEMTHQHYFDYVLLENYHGYFENKKNILPNDLMAKKESMRAMIWFMLSALFLMMCFWGKRNRK